MSKQKPFYLRSEPNPQNDPAEWLAGFETEEQMAQRHAARDQLLFNANPMLRPNFHWCTEHHACDSGGCPWCMRAFRRWWVDAGITLLAQSPGPLSVASLVHHSLSRCPGELNTFDLSRAKRQLARQLDRVGLGRLIALGGFDFSYDQPTVPLPPYWQPHAYVIFQGTEPKQIKRALTPLYPATTKIPRPIRTRKVTDLMEALSYAVKSAFWRRSSYFNDQEVSNTRTLPLPSGAKRELIAYLDQLCPVDRLSLKNVRRRGAKLIVERGGARPRTNRQLK
jgi:hypothetical protein